MISDITSVTAWELVEAFAELVAAKVAAQRGPAPEASADPWAQEGPQAAPRATESAPGPLGGGGTRPGPNPGYAANAGQASAGSASYAQGAAQPSRPSVLNVKGPQGMQTWTLNPPGGPECKCGEPAALVHGPKAKGGFFDAYRCAKGSGDNWRNKCDFNKWT